MAFGPSARHLVARDNSGVIILLDDVGFALLRTLHGLGGSATPSPPQLIFDAGERWLAVTRGPAGGPARWRLDDTALAKDLRDRLGR